MNEEQIRKIASDEFNKNIMINLDSSIIFKYIQGLEEENQKQKETIDEISKIVHEIKELTETTNGYPSDYIDNLLEILKEVE